MKRTSIILKNISDIRKFVNEVTMIDYEVDLEQGRYIVDAKSIMGIFSLDLTKTISVEAHTEDASKFAEELKPYIVE